MGVAAAVADENLTPLNLLTVGMLTFDNFENNQIFKIAMKLNINCSAFLIVIQLPLLGLTSLNSFKNDSRRRRGSRGSRPAPGRIAACVQRAALLEPNQRAGKDGV